MALRFPDHHLVHQVDIVQIDPVPNPDQPRLLRIHDRGQILSHQRVPNARERMDENHRHIVLQIQITECHSQPVRGHWSIPCKHDFLVLIATAT